MMINLLFVCVENANRSQMAQAFANIHGGDKVTAFSAGSAPSGKVNEKAIAAMAELDYDLSIHDSTSINDIPSIKYNYIVTMGCGDKCPLVEADNKLDWAIPDPKHMDKVAFNEVRDLISEKVKDIIEKVL